MAVGDHEIQIRLKGNFKKFVWREETYNFQAIRKVEKNTKSWVCPSEERKHGDPGTVIH